MNYGIFIIIAIIQAISALTHWFLYKSFVFFYNPTSTSTLWSLRAGIGILSVTFLIATIITHNSAGQSWQYFYEAAASWLGILHWLMLSSIVAWIIYIISLYLGVNLPGGIYYSILLGLGLIISVYGFYNAFTIRTTKLNLALPNLPAAWQGETIAFVSDLHLGDIYGAKFANRVVNTINAAKPEIVLIGGDVYDSAKVDLEKIITPFHEFSVPQGIYFITGNHEEFGDSSPYLNALTTTNVVVLDNKIVNLKGLQIAGVDYNDTRTLSDFEKILTTINLNHNLPSILLKHVPEYIDTATKAGFSLQLYGHTHRGQMWPFNYITQAVYRGFDYGYKKTGESQVYTSSGVGTWGPPLKVGNPAEVVIITLVSQ